MLKQTNISQIVINRIKYLLLFIFKKLVVIYKIIIIEEYSMDKYSTHSLARLSFGLHGKFPLLVVRTLNAKTLFYTLCLIYSNSSNSESTWS